MAAPPSVQFLALLLFARGSVPVDRLPFLGISCCECDNRKTSGGMWVNYRCVLWLFFSQLPSVFRIVISDDKANGPQLQVRFLLLFSRWIPGHSKRPAQKGRCQGEGYFPRAQHQVQHRSPGS